MHSVLVLLLASVLSFSVFAEKTFAQACGANTPRYCVDSSGNIWANGMQARTGATGTFTLGATQVTHLNLTDVTNQILLASGATNTGQLTMAALTASRTWTLPNSTGTLVGTGDSGVVTGTMIAATTVTSSNLNVTPTTCTNQFLTAISSGAVGTCTTPTLAGAQFANQGTTTTILHGNALGNPSWSAVVSADLNVTPTTCTNQFLTAISSGAVGTCTTSTLAGAQFANQGTTTTILHGNAVGNPSWSAVALTTDVTGTLGVGNGGTGIASGVSGGILGYTSTTTLASSAALAQNGFVLGGGVGATPTALQITGLVKGNGASAPTAAVVGTDYCSSASTCETGTWSNIGNAKDTVYQNASGRKRRVAVGISAAASGNNYLSFLVGSTNPPGQEIALCPGAGLTGVTAGNLYCTAIVEVPNAWYYKASTGAGIITILDWHELDE